MKAIGIKKQKRLSFSRTFILTIIGIRYRLFRSIVTLAVVVLAIAFMMNVISESVIKNAIATTSKIKIRERRLASEWKTHLTIPGSPEEIIRKLAAADSANDMYQEFAVMSGVSGAAMNNFYQKAKEAVVYLDYFENLAYANRRKLIQDLTGVRVFEFMQTPSNLDRLFQTLESMKSLRFVTAPDTFKSFLSQWPAQKATIEEIIKKRTIAVRMLDSVVNEHVIMELLVDANGDFGKEVRAAGFILRPETAEKLSGQAKRMLDKDIIEKSITIPEMTKRLCSFLDVLPSKINVQTVWKMLGNRQKADWFLKQLTEVEPKAAEMDLEKLIRMAQMKKEDEALFVAERIGADSGSGIFGISMRMAWLILISIIVCIVGIANVMLMSVTERFREIATLKCLGALDGFIMVSYMIEASLIGIIGGFIGSIIGAIIGSGRMLIAYGGLMLSSVNPASLAGWMGVSVVMGIVLAVGAAVYPSLRAAKLAPMEAMRIE